MKTPITQAGIDNLNEKITRLKSELDELKEEMKDVQSSQASHDENPDLAVLENKFKSTLKLQNDLKEIIQQSIVIDINEIDTDKVRFGSIVTIENLDTEEQVTYQLLSEHESNPSNGSISYTSPFGKAMIGLCEEDTFIVSVRNKETEYEIIKIGK